jgi:superfamily II DNA/RNA helicase
VEWFSRICAPVILRRRKTDADVRAQFPPFTEKFVLCQMHADQRELYQRLEDLAWDDKGNYQKVPGLGVLLRQFICDPLAIKYSSSALGKMIWEELQVELEKCTSAKAEELVRQLDAITGNGHKAIVFTFFGQSVLKALQERLADFQVHVYHGEMTPAQKEAAKRAFLDTPGGRILLASDAGARGINAPCGYILEYEPARTPSLRTQRAGRGHRIDSDIPVTLMTLVTEDSLEDANAIPQLLERNEMQDLVLGDTEAEGYTTADDRREMFARAKRRKLA